MLVLQLFAGGDAASGHSLSSLALHEDMPATSTNKAYIDFSAYVDVAATGNTHLQTSGGGKTMRMYVLKHLRIHERYSSYSSIGGRRTWSRRTARLEFLGNLRTSQAGILELRTILKITVNNSHAPHRTQDLLRVVDWQPNACTHFFDLGSCVADFRITMIVEIRTKRLE